MGALDNIEDELGEEPGKARGAGPDTVRREIDGQSAKDVLARRSARWEALVPEGVTGKQRDELEASLDVAHFALNVSSDDLAKMLVKFQEDVAREKGLEPDDPAVGRAVARRMIREVREQALTHDMLADCAPENRKRLGQVSAVARSLGYSPQQVGTLLADALVSTEGDKDKAILLFQSFINDDSMQRGFWGKLPVEALERGADALTTSAGEPEFAPYPADASVTVSTNLGDEASVGVTPLANLRGEIIEDEDRRQRADQQVANLDIYAAENLKPADYAVYRIMRDNAGMLGVRKNEYGDRTVNQAVEDELNYTKQGASMAVKRVVEQLSRADLTTELVPSQKGAERIVLPTADVISRLDNKRMRSAAALE